MFNGKSDYRIGVQHSGRVEPPCSESDHLLPTRPLPTAPSHERLPPQAHEAISEAGQHGEISRDSLMLVIASNYGSEPSTSFAHRAMHAAAQLQLDCCQARPHPLRHRATPHLELSTPGSSTDVRHSQKIERLGWTVTTVLPVRFGIPPKLDQSRFLRMQRQTEMRESFRQCCPKSLRIFSVLECEDDIVGVTNDKHLPIRLAPPLTCPEIQRVVQVYVRQ
jgi:hypothetical protein